MRVAHEQRARMNGEVRGIVEAHYADVLAYCRRRTRSREEAQDATQEVFLRFIRAQGRYRDAGKPRAYLLTIARNVCIDIGRAHVYDWADLPPDEALPDVRLPDTEDAHGADGLARAYASLTHEHREVLELRFDQELTVTETARVLGISRFAAKRRIDAALTALRAALQQDVRDAEKGRTT